MGLFDFNWGDGSDSLWEEDRGFWNNIGNLGTNLVGGVGGGIGGFLLGGPIYFWWRCCWYVGCCRCWW